MRWIERCACTARSTDQSARLGKPNQIELRDLPLDAAPEEPEKPLMGTR